MHDRCGARAGVLVLLALAGSLQAEEKVYQAEGIDIDKVNEPRGDARHGYAEYSFRIVNQTEKTKRVTLEMPAESYGGAEIRAIRRTIEVQPLGGAARDRAPLLVLYQPPIPQLQGSGIRVSIDGKTLEEPLSRITIRNTTRHDAYLGRYYGRGHYGGSKSMSIGPGYGSSASLVLVSPSVPDEAVVALKSRRGGSGGVKSPPGPRPAPVAPGLPGRKLEDPPEPEPDPGPELFPRALVPGDPGTPARPGEVVYSGFAHHRGEPVRSWSTNWLGYSRHEGVIITAEDRQTLEREKNLTPLWEYVETGGVLVIVGEAKGAPGWKPIPKGNWTLYTPGLGVCVVMNADPGSYTEDMKRLVQDSIAQTGHPFQGVGTVLDANQMFEVVKDVGIPVRGLFVLMLGFVIVIGPVNLLLLSKWKRRIWMLWTVPVVSFLTVGAVFGYMLVAEGWSRHQKTQVLTIYDDSTERATTIGWTAFYSPVTPSEGLMFEDTTELMIKGTHDDMEEYYGYRRRPRSSRSCSMEWLDGGQHLEKGWMSARVPVHFQVRKSKTQTRQIKVRREADGSLHVFNGLPNAITRFSLADEQGQLHTTRSIPAGAQAKLEATRERISPQPEISWRKRIYAEPWLRTMRNPSVQPREYLQPLTYVADVDGTPYLEDGLANAKYRDCQSVVLGLLTRIER